MMKIYDLLMAGAITILLLYMGGFTTGLLFDDKVVEAPVAESSAIIFEEGELVVWEAAPIYYDWKGDLIVPFKHP